jgi:hypothetical protein
MAKSRIGCAGRGVWHVLVGVNFGAMIVTAGRLLFGLKGFQRQQNEPGTELLITKVFR